jgi:lambda repressor-like predicted transcriptional regulator
MSRTTASNQVGPKAQRIIANALSVDPNQLMATLVGGT